MYNYFFFIYSCKKYLKKAILIYDLINNRLPNCKTYIIYGNPELKKYEIIDDKYLVLNVGDNYEDLTNKTLCLLKTALLINPEINGIFKCDDDIIPNISYLTNTIALLQKKQIDYLGMSVKIQPHNSIWHYNKCSNASYNTEIFAPGCFYATGPIYYLGIKSIEVLINSPVERFFSEDITVGYNLNKQGIEPVNIPLYKNNLEDIFQYNFQNIDSNVKTLLVRLHGGLGNQLFQAAAGYYLAKKYSFILVLVYSKNLKHTHGEEFSKTIFKRFNVVITDNISYYDNCIPLNEPNNNKTCFEYHGEQIISSYENHFLTGYFIHKDYVKNAGPDFIKLLKNTEICKELQTTYPQLNTSYFIHIRRGDYVGHKLYVIDYDSYFTKAIHHILSIDKDAHFFIVSDDIAFCKTYNIFNNINKTFIENMDTLHSIYFMSMCSKGGICSNSTFSGWGTVLNYSEDKTIIFPNQWINTPQKVDIPFDYSVSF
uniref:Uncharacterized protein n=1 Tax=viral metagenome TaxID=1070528 RepID=A0A6C0JZF7_9ZZZZ